MLLNKERMLQKMEEFNLDVVIASHPENVSYLADFQSHLPYMYRFLNVESFALFPRRADIAPALIVSKSDVSWAARYPSWMPEVYTFGNDGYTVYPGGTLSEGEKRFKEMLDDHDRHAAAAGEAIVKALKAKGLDKGRIGLDEKNIYPATRELIAQGLPQAEILDAFELIRIVRMVKTPEEMERISVAGLLNERATLSVLDRLAEGVTEEELVQHFLEATAKEGAVFEFWNTASGTNSSMNIMSYGHHHPRARYRPQERGSVPVRRGEHLQPVSFRCRRGRRAGDPERADEDCATGRSKSAWRRPWSSSGRVSCLRRCTPRSPPRWRRPGSRTTPSNPISAATASASRPGIIRSSASP